jgi:hypothetical protein
MIATTNGIVATINGTVATIATTAVMGIAIETAVDAGADVSP